MSMKGLYLFKSTNLRGIYSLKREAYSDREGDCTVTLDTILTDLKWFFSLENVL